MNWKWSWCCTEGKIHFIMLVLSFFLIFGVKIQIVEFQLNVKNWLFFRHYDLLWWIFFLHLESVLAKMVLVPPPWVFHDFSEFYGCLGLILLGTLLTVFEVVKRFIELLVICLSRDFKSGSRFVHQSNHNIHPFLWLEEILKSDLAYIFRKRRSWL